MKFLPKNDTYNTVNKNKKNSNKAHDIDYNKRVSTNHKWKKDLYTLLRWLSTVLKCRRFNQDGLGTFYIRIMCGVCNGDGINVP